MAGSGDGEPPGRTPCGAAPASFATQRVRQANRGAGRRSEPQFRENPASWVPLSPFRLCILAVSLDKSGRCSQKTRAGEVAEWLKAHAWKACIRETVSRVRIPLSPPDLSGGFYQAFHPEPATEEPSQFIEGFAVGPWVTAERTRWCLACNLIIERGNPASVSRKKAAPTGRHRLAKALSSVSRSTRSKALLKWDIASGLPQPRSPKCLRRVIFQVAI